MSFKSCVFYWKASNHMDLMFLASIWLIVYTEVIKRKYRALWIDYYVSKKSVCYFIADDYFIFWYCVCDEDIVNILFNTCFITSCICTQSDLDSVFKTKRTNNSSSLRMLNIIFYRPVTLVDIWKVEDKNVMLVVYEISVLFRSKQELKL